jgi:hypothetical protein
MTGYELEVEEELEQEENQSGEYASPIGPYNPDVTKMGRQTRLAAYNTYYKQMLDGYEDEKNGRYLQVDAAYRIYSNRLWKAYDFGSVDRWLVTMQSEGLLDFGKTKFYEIMSAIETSIGAGMDKEKAIRLGSTHSSSINQLKVLGAVEVKVEDKDKRKPRLPTTISTSSGVGLLGNGVSNMAQYIDELGDQTPADAWKTVRKDLGASSIWIQSLVPYSGPYFDEKGAKEYAVEVCSADDTNGTTPWMCKILIEKDTPDNVVEFIKNKLSPKVGGKAVRSLNDV